MLRHEQQTVRMALAAALHHSAGPEVKKVELQQHAALRGQKTGTRAGEGEVREKYGAPRRQNAPHPGVRPGSLFDPGPQRSDRTVRHSAGDTPLLVVPALHGENSETLVLKEEKERRPKKEEEEKEQFLEQSMQELRFLLETPLAGGSLQQTRRMMELLKLRDAASSSSSKRKRKKRRKNPPPTHPLPSPPTHPPPLPSSPSSPLLPPSFSTHTTTQPHHHHHQVQNTLVFSV